MTMIRTIGLLSGVAALSVSGIAGAIEIDNASIDQLRAELNELREQNNSLTSRLDTEDAQWLNETRASEIRGIVQDVLADSKNRTSLQDSGAMAGYKAGNGFFLSNQDGSFSMNISGQIQTRFIMSKVKADPVSLIPVAGDNNNKTDYGFQVRRAKLRFAGNVADPSWGYNIQGAMESDGGFTFEDVVISKAMDSGLTVSVGQFKAPWLREELVSSQNQLAVERSMVNEYFNAGRVVGVNFGWKQDAWSLDVSANNGGSTALDNISGLNTNSSNNFTKWAAQGRFQYKLSGDWSDFDSFTSSAGDEEAMMIGFAGMGQQYNGETINTAGGTNDDLSVWGVTADFSAKFSGLSLFASATWQNFRQSDAFGGSTNKVNPWGVVAQAGYTFSDQWELFGRFSWANNDGLGSPALTPAEAKLAVLTVGANYFVNSNVKFTVDWGLNFDDSMDGLWVDQADTGWRETQAKDEWVLRAQLQLVF